jgi:hypothetical protein
MKKLKHWIMLVFFNLAIALLFVGALEMFVRLTIPEIQELGTDASLITPNTYGPSAGLTPNCTAKCYGAAVRTDSEGFIQYSSNDLDHGPSWLILGDSVTMGVGVNSDSTFSGLLAASLDSLKVLNPSLIGYSSRDYVNVLRVLLPPPPARGDTI